MRKAPRPRTNQAPLFPRLSPTSSTQTATLSPASPSFPGAGAGAAAVALSPSPAAPPSPPGGAAGAGAAAGAVPGGRLLLFDLCFEAFASGTQASSPPPSSSPAPVRAGERETGVGFSLSLVPAGERVRAAPFSPRPHALLIAALLLHSSLLPRISA